MKILATDLDRTLLPNGSWPPDPGAIDLFNELTETHDVLVVYVTGRNLALTEDAIKEFGLFEKDFLPQITHSICNICKEKIKKEIKRN